MLEETGCTLLNIALPPIQWWRLAFITACQQGAPDIIGCQITLLGSCFCTEPAPDDVQLLAGRCGSEEAAPDRRAVLSDNMSV